MSATAVLNASLAVVSSSVMAPNSTAVCLMVCLVTTGVGLGVGPAWVGVGVGLGAVGVLVGAAGVGFEVLRGPRTASGHTTVIWIVLDMCGIALVFASSTVIPSNEFDQPRPYGFPGLFPENRPRSA